MYHRFRSRHAHSAVYEEGLKDDGVVTADGLSNLASPYDLRFAATDAG